MMISLIALRQNLHRRCREVNIDCREWKDGNSPDDARIVLIIPKSVRSDDFIRFLNRIQKQKRLDRIVIDECHVVLNERYDFRSQLQELSELNRARVFIVMLTITLPLIDEERFLKKMWLRFNEIQIFRIRITRTNIRYRTYHIRERTDDQQDTNLLRFIRETQNRLIGREKIVIYSSQINDCQSLTASIDCDAYFHETEDKTNVFERFVADSQRNIIVAISAFGMKIDVSHIRWVIHVNESRFLLDYSQENERAKRNDVTNQTMIIRDRTKKKDHVKFYIDINRHWINKYLKTSCKRVMLNLYLNDKINRNSCEMNEQTCENCENKKTVKTKNANSISNTSRSITCKNIIMNIIVTRHQQKIRNAQANIQIMRQTLNRLRERCVYCFITEQTQESDHFMFHCQIGNCSLIRTEYQKRKQRIRRDKALKLYEKCNICFVSQKWCNQWREKTETDNVKRYERVFKQREHCQYQNVIIELLTVLIHAQEKFRDQMRRRMSTGMNWNNVSYYWNQRTRWADIDMYQMMMKMWKKLKLRNDDRDNIRKWNSYQSSFRLNESVITEMTNWIKSEKTDLFVK